jgi:2-hydroxychromene-2-carboxylate isomerase
METLDFIFDFGSPNAYLVHKVLPEFKLVNRIKINCIPCLLGGIFKQTNNRSQMEAFANILGKSDYENLELKRFIEKHKINNYKPNPFFPVNTLILMRGAIVAHREDWLDNYIEAGFHHMWEDPKDMGDQEVYKNAMLSSGFNISDLLTKIQANEVKEQLITNTKRAVEKGVFGVPTFFLGNQMFFGKERLMQIEAILSD